MDRAITTFKEQGLGDQSLFVDIGSGFGKPIFHCALMTKAKCIGVEFDHSRWEYSNNLLVKLRKEARGNHILEEVFDRIKFINADILETDCLQSGTHFYSFNWLFPE
jgi:SAM-dependent methyltransferase